MKRVSEPDIRKMADQLAEKLHGTITQPNDKTLTVWRTDMWNKAVHLCDIIYTDDYIYFRIDVRIEEKYYRDVYEFLFKIWFPQLLDCSHTDVLYNINISRWAEVAETTINRHRVEYRYGVNAFRFKIYTKNRLFQRRKGKALA